MTSAQKRENRETKRKREMALLRETLLSGSASPVLAEVEERKYVDRAAARRKLHPPELPPRQHQPALPEAARKSNVTSGPAPMSQFSQTMMASQGWAPGQGLGRGSNGRSVPIETELRTERRGLGAQGEKAVVAIEGPDWRRRAKERRYDQLRSSGV